MRHAARLLVTIAALALTASASPPGQTLLSGPQQNVIVTPNNWHCC